MPNLYEILDIERTATADEIKAAYRRKSKVLHPNAGGAASKEAFLELKNAYDVLRSPSRRQHYDETGETQNEKAHNDHKFALELIRTMMETAIGQVLSFPTDEIYNNPIEVMTGVIEQHIQTIAQDIANKRGEIVRLVKLAKRFGASEGQPVLAMMVEYRIGNLERSVEGGETQIRHHRSALDILALQTFKPDRQPQWTQPFGGPGQQQQIGLTQSNPNWQQQR